MEEKRWTLEEISIETGIPIRTLRDRAKKKLTKYGRDWLLTEAEKMLIVRNGGRAKKEAPGPEPVQDRPAAKLPSTGTLTATQKWWEKGPLPALPTKPKAKKED